MDAYLSTKKKKKRNIITERWKMQDLLAQFSNMSKDAAGILSLIGASFRGIFWLPVQPPSYDLFSCSDM